MARWLIILGSLLIVLGALYWLAPWLFTWFGKLPGDVRFESGRTRVFIPITSMLLLSVVLSLLLYLFRR
jgi:hypothetical protein